MEADPSQGPSAGEVHLPELSPELTLGVREALGSLRSLRLSTLVRVAAGVGDQEGLCLPPPSFGYNHMLWMGILE